MPRMMKKISMLVFDLVKNYERNIQGQGKGDVADPIAYDYGDLWMAAGSVWMIAVFAKMEQ